jgi:uncharacterized membrane protein
VTTLRSRLKDFGAFWYDFVVGDDWRIAAGVVVALFVTWGVSRSSVPSWWILPAGVAVFLSVSLWMATRAARGSRRR